MHSGIGPRGPTQVPMSPGNHLRHKKLFQNKHQTEKELLLGTSPIIRHSF